MWKVWSNNYGILWAKTMSFITVYFGETMGYIGQELLDILGETYDILGRIYRIYQAKPWDM